MGQSGASERTSPNSLGIYPVMTGASFLREICLIWMLVLEGRTDPRKYLEGKSECLGTFTNKTAPGLMKGSDL